MIPDGAIQSLHLARPLDNIQMDEPMRKITLNVHEQVCDWARVLIFNSSLNNLFSYLLILFI